MKQEMNDEIKEKIKIAIKMNNGGDIYEMVKDIEEVFTEMVEGELKSFVEYARKEAIGDTVCPSQLMEIDELTNYFKQYLLERKK